MPSVVIVGAAKPVSSITSGGSVAPGRFERSPIHKSLPVFTSKQNICLWVSSAPERNARSPQTIGEFNPGRGTFVFQSIPSSVSKPMGILSCLLTPFPCGPLKAGQFTLNSSKVRNADAGGLVSASSFAERDALLKSISGWLRLYTAIEASRMMPAVIACLDHEALTS